MLFIPPKEYSSLMKTLKEGHENDPVGSARRALELRPDFAPAWLILGVNLEDKNEAEAALWKALELWPCTSDTYLSLAELLTQRDESDVIAKRLRLLALWKVSFADKVPELLGKHFEKTMGVSAWEPETYDLLAVPQE